MNKVKWRHFRYFRYTVVLLAMSTAVAQGQDRFEWKGGKWVAQAKPAKGTPEGELELVRHHIEMAHPKKAVKVAKKYLGLYPDRSEYEEVCLLAGQAEIARGRYWQAFEWFEKQLTHYPAGKLSDQAMEHEFEIADAFLAGKKRIVLGFLRLGAEGEALEILSRIAEHSPGTRIAERALLRIAERHYQKQRWAEAVDSYDLFIELFPKSAKTPMAMFQAAQAQYELFQGAQFDDTPLLEAEQRFKILAESYPTAARNANVPMILQNIVDSRAEKLYRTALFYERTARKSPAVYYYRQVTARYPKTTWASDAEVAIERLGDVKPVRPAARPAKQPASTGKAPQAN